VRVGYYVSNEYDTPELQNEPPKQPILDRIVRNMLTEKPRVTRFAIKWYVSRITTNVILIYRC
jgi:histone chaperone ASF1